MNVVAEGTGTRCPLYITCIHTPGLPEPQCELTGCKQCADDSEEPLTYCNVFHKVTIHNQKHVKGGFSATPLRLRVKSQLVQNMMFVDLPGIITAQGKGEDKREAIKTILRKEMREPNTKLLVLLEPKEFDTNSIIDFVDDALGEPPESREWPKRSLFLMTKFDLRVPDSLTGGKSNRFFEKYWEEGIKPFCVVTPTMQKSADGMKADAQYTERSDILSNADDYEDNTLSDWMRRMDTTYRQDPTCEALDSKFKDFMGFRSAVATMHSLLLEDTRTRLPEVVQDLKSRLEHTRAELKSLEVATKFMDKDGMQLLMSEVLQAIVRRI
eukprot:3509357-Amphidinium_carterae.1